jgi:primosomal protein N'
MSAVFVRVALDHPLPTLFDYRYDLAPEPAPGLLVRVPFGRRDVVGLICEVTERSDVPAEKLRAVDAICDACAPLADEWRALAAFAADYYQRGLGEVALPALPQALRDASRWARLFAPEERYRLLPAGRAALPDALPVRASALRRLAEALAAQPTLAAADARALHPKASATLDDWQSKGWVVLETADDSTGAAQPSALTDDALLPCLTHEQQEAVAARRHGQRQDRGLPARARRLAPPAAGRAGARARPRNQPDAAVRSRFPHALRGAAGRRDRHDAQRPRRGRARAQLACRAHRTRANRARHSARDPRFAAEAFADRRRRGA